MKDNLMMKTLAVAIVYFLLRFMGGSLGEKALYPITLLVTFLHEFGHVWSSISNVRSYNQAKYGYEAAKWLDDVYAEKYANHWGGWPLNGQVYTLNKSWLFDLPKGTGINAFNSLTKKY